MQLVRKDGLVRARATIGVRRRESRQMLLSTFLQEMVKEHREVVEQPKALRTQAVSSHAK